MISNQTQFEKYLEITMKLIMTVMIDHSDNKIDIS